MIDDYSEQYYKPIIRTEEFQLLYMYLYRVEMIGRYYRNVSRGWYNNTVDARAILDFFSNADEYFHFAEENMRHFLKPEEYDELKLNFTADNDGRPPKRDIRTARRIFQLFQLFGWNSGLLKLQQTTPVGKFGKIYAGLGLQRQKPKGEGD